jgi:hypothetical protein
MNWQLPYFKYRKLPFLSTESRDFTVASVIRLTRAQVVDIKRRLYQGDHQHDIAAAYGLNQGRISEINTGKRYADIVVGGDSLVPSEVLVGCDRSFASRFPRRVGRPVAYRAGIFAYSVSSDWRRAFIHASGPVGRVLNSGSMVRSSIGFIG